MLDYYFYLLLREDHANRVLDYLKVIHQLVNVLDLNPNLYQHLYKILELSIILEQ